MEKVENFLSKLVGPLTTKMNSKLFFQALSEAFMRTLPITLGGSLLMIIGNFPIPGWIEWLKEINFYQHFLALQGATMNALALYIVFMFTYLYVKKAGYDPLAAGMLSLACFFLLMPQQIIVPTLKETVSTFPATAEVTGTTTVEAFQTMYTGSVGLFSAIIVGYIVARLFIWLYKKNIVIKLPSSVPTNISESFQPILSSAIILIIFFLIRLGFYYLAELVPVLKASGADNMFLVISGIITFPLQALFSSPYMIIVLYSLINLLWFFGIHPNVVYALAAPVFQANLLDNQNAFLHGEPLPFLIFAIVTFVCGNGFGGQGSTYGLIFSMKCAKSQRYKELFKLSIVPSIFNINEPLIFGVPIIMNPTFLLPMLLTPAAMGGTAVLLAKLLNFTKLNPMMNLPWTTPGPIVLILQGGVKYGIILVAILIINFIIWWPFFRIADKAAVADEQESANHQ